jgi:energy-coupling factor transporter ATP-binding protein EcfA2
MYLNKNFEYNELNINLLATSINVAKTDRPQIRIIASGNLSSYVEAKSIFEKIFRETYPNSSISLESTSDIVLEQVIANAELTNLEEALDRDKIVNLSKQYIIKLVDSTSTIDKDDKEEAKKYIIDLFVEEFNKHTFEQILNKIDVSNFEISNFMNFDEAKIQFKANKINRITGTNGIGKTKIWSVMSWLLTDSITNDQNSKEKTYNYSLLFNDSSEIDEVTGKIEFFVNGEAHILDKKLIRSWKTGKKDINHPEWWKLLKGAPIVEQRLIVKKITGDVEYKNQEVTEYLSNLIGSFKDFETSTFVDGVNLRNLKNRPTSYIIQQILDAMGLTIIDNLLESYNSIKDEKLNSLKKPEYTGKEYLALVENEKELLSNASNTIDALSNKIQTANDEIYQKEKEISSKNLSKHSVKTELELLGEKQQLTNSIDELEKRNLAIDNAFETSKEALQIDYDKLLNDKTLELSEALEKLNSKKLTISDNSVKIQEIKLEQKNLLVTESEKWNTSANEKKTLLMKIVTK